MGELLAFLFIFLVLIGCPIFVMKLFSNKKLIRYRKNIFYFSVVMAIMVIIGIIMDISAKSSIVNLFVCLSIYMVILFGLMSLWTLRRYRIVRIICASVLGIPLIIIMLVIIILAPNISFGGYDGYEKTFSFEGYTVYSYIEFSDNTKETVAVTIYEELPILCFLEYKMYETKEINKYLEKAEYDMDAKTMYLTMLSGNTISTEIVHLRK